MTEKANGRLRKLRGYAGGGIKRILGALLLSEISSARGGEAKKHHAWRPKAKERG